MLSHGPAHAVLSRFDADFFLLEYRLAPRHTRPAAKLYSDSDQTRHEEMGVSGLTFNMCLARLAANAVIEPWLRLCAALVFVPPKRLFKVL